MHTKCRVEEKVPQIKHIIIGGKYGARIINKAKREIIKDSV